MYYKKVEKKGKLSHVLLVPEASPRDVRCTALSSDKLQVSWQPPPESLVHGVIQGYRLLYEPVPAPDFTSNGRGVFNTSIYDFYFLNVRAS
jgi:hypothetical protein